MTQHSTIVRLAAVLALVFTASRGASAQPATTAPATQPRPAQTPPPRRPMLTIPFHRLIRVAAGVAEPAAASFKPLPDPRAKVAPELLAAYHAMNAARRATAIADSPADFANSYAAHINANVPWAFPSVRINDTTAVREMLPVTTPGGSSRPARENARLWEACAAREKQYAEAYKKYGDPTARLPDPLAKDYERSDDNDLTEAKLVAVTADDRVLATTTGGKPKGTGTRLWVVGQTKASAVLEEGAAVVRDGQALGKLGAFTTLTGNARGDVMLLAKLTDPVKPAYQRAASLLAWNPSAGLRVVATASEALPDLGDDWYVQSLQSCSLDADGNAAVVCKAVHGADAATKDPVVLLWTGGKPRVGGYHVGKRMQQMEVAVRQPKRGKPRPPVKTDVQMEDYRLGDETVSLKWNEATLDLTATAFLPGGRFAFFGEHKAVVNKENARVQEGYAVHLGTRKLTHFETGGPGRTWFADDGTVALVDTDYKAQFGAQMPVGLRVGPPDQAKPIADFATKGVFGIGEARTFAGFDSHGRKMTVALGPNGLIAFSGFVPGDERAGRYDPNEGRVVQAGAPPNQWQLFVGTRTEAGSIWPVAHEGLRAGPPSPGDAAAGPVPAGRCSQMAFTTDGTLLFCTDGELTSRVERELPAVGPQTGLVWAWDARRGLRLIARVSDGVAVPAGSDSYLGDFHAALCPDGRIVLTRAANDCVFITSAGPE